jgi:hypothetical protein
MKSEHMWELLYLLNQLMTLPIVVAENSWSATPPILGTRTLRKFSIVLDSLRAGDAAYGKSSTA